MKSFSPRLKLTAQDVTILQTSHLPSALQCCVQDVENATSHQAVTAAVVLLRAMLVAAGATEGMAATLHKYKWREALARYVSCPCRDKSSRNKVYFEIVFFCDFIKD